jgi:hypothetical protein
MEQKNKVCSFTELGAGCWSEAFRNTRKTRRTNATAAYKYIEYNNVPGMSICFFGDTYFQDCKNQWSMSRPLLGLILINSENFGKVQESLCSSQSPEKLQGLSQVFIIFNI